MGNLEKLSMAVQVMKEEYPNGGFKIETFEVEGDKAVATIKIGKKKCKRTFDFTALAGA